MCGIAGLYRFAAARADGELQRTADAMTDTLAHRGPDSRGTWVDAAAGIALGHRRLAIRDLSPTGCQPMLSSCGRMAIAYNGEVYSHLEIARRLEGRGRRMRGTSDTEVIVEACAEWGIEAVLPEMIGMFAFALFDRQRREIVLARDRMGIKPLYWGVFDGVLMFGSELKALRACAGWTPELDRDALSAFLRHNYIPAPHSIYRGVHKLPPGCLLRLGADGVPRISPFWDLRAVVEGGLADPARGSDEDLLAELDALLGDAVKRRMVSDVPLGALLSGGIDSSLVTALMTENSAQPINTFSIGFREKGFDEAPFAREIARHLATRHTELYVEPGDALKLVDDLPLWYDEPFADSSQIPTALVCALTRRHVSVVLSGDGGDELFAGYGRYPLALERWAQAAALPRPARRLGARALLAAPEGLLDLAGAALRRPRLGHRLHAAARAVLDDGPDALYRRMLSHWPEPDALVPGGHEPKGVLWDASVARTIPDFLDRMQFLDTATYLPDDILTKVDRASMSVALEARVPLLDHRVVEFSWRLPQRMKRRGGESKWALRQILDKRVPSTLIDRPKMGFGIPLAAWLRGPLRDWAENLLDEERLKTQGVFAAAPVRERWRAHLNGENWGYPLWNVLMAQAWIDANPGTALR
ncbi:asparagine synthase (glutamine-hydrolyzing) [Oleispirillum naphthae]|uniref:asparagine synthase (glutamine-hydrolyzing) n=1 Tax=Oleispirillum naphthae TaxID=2838853 RepID=UPI00308263C0